MTAPDGDTSRFSRLTSIAALRALRYRNFRLFFLGQSISLIGTWMQIVAMSWLVYRLTGSALMLGVIGFCGQLPTLIITPIAGVLADRWVRRTMLIVTHERDIAARVDRNIVLRDGGIDSDTAGRRIRAAE